MSPWVAAGAGLSWLQPTSDGLPTIAAGRAPEIFYNDCDAESVVKAENRLRPQSAASFQQEVGATPERSLRSVYIVCRQDRAIAAAGQRQMAERAGRIVAMPTGHCPFICQPEQLSERYGGRQLEGRLATWWRRAAIWPSRCFIARSHAFCVPRSPR
ncbi:MAG: alpha/beta hydrolase [Actinomycetota bacterium]